jgi:hypothetical protein
MQVTTLLSHQVQLAGAYGESTLFFPLTVRSVSWWFERKLEQLLYLHLFPRDQMKYFVPVIFIITT